MAEEPITIRGGGSLHLESTLELEALDATKKKHKYKDPTGRDGSIIGVTIDGKRYPARKNSVIVIHYDVP